MASLNFLNGLLVKTIMTRLWPNTATGINIDPDSFTNIKKGIGINAKTTFGTNSVMVNGWYMIGPIVAIAIDIMIAVGTGRHIVSMVIAVTDTGLVSVTATTGAINTQPPGRRSQIDVFARCLKVIRLVLQAL